MEQQYYFVSKNFVDNNSDWNNDIFTSIVENSMNSAHDKSLHITNELNFNNKINENNEQIYDENNYVSPYEEMNIIHNNKDNNAMFFQDLTVNNFESVSVQNVDYVKCQANELVQVNIQSDLNREIFHDEVDIVIVNHNGNEQNCNFNASIYNDDIIQNSNYNDNSYTNINNDQFVNVNKDIDLDIPNDSLRNNDYNSILATMQNEENLNMNEIEMETRMDEDEESGGNSNETEETMNGAINLNEMMRYYDLTDLSNEDLSVFHYTR